MCFTPCVVHVCTPCTDSKSVESFVGGGEVGIIYLVCSESLNSHLLSLLPVSIVLDFKFTSNALLLIVAFKYIEMVCYNSTFQSFSHWREREIYIYITLICNNYYISYMFLKFLLAFLPFSINKNYF